jgi:hypothetical protein
MDNTTMRAKECAYSFYDLFFASTGRAMTKDEARQFSSLSQPERNIEVKKLAVKAKWATRCVIGTDAQEYVAFCPSNI